jgi:hypothetical protein
MESAAEASDFLGTFAKSSARLADQRFTLTSPPGQVSPAPALSARAVTPSRDALPGTYPGGKRGAGVWQTLLNLIPPHRRWFELFAGGAGLWQRKAPAETSARRC